MRESLMIALLITCVGCSALPPLKSADEETMAACGSVPRGYVLVFKMDERQKEDFLNTALLNPRTIDSETGGEGYWHVGLCIGNGMMIHGWDRIRVDPIAACGPFDAFDSGASPRQVEEMIWYLRSRLGQEYDLLEAVSKGVLDDPKKSICTSLLIEAFRSVPDERNGLTRLLQSIDVHQGKNRFVSANLLADYFIEKRLCTPELARVK